MSTIRLDTLLAQKETVGSRERAKRLIQDGQVLVDGKVVTKPAALVELTAEIQVTSPAERFASRGGYKLEKALELFSVSLSGCLCLDVGASTGGFTDCMLQHGAEKVYAVDVGHDQLVPALRQDPRVVNMEGTNFRTLLPEQFPQLFDFASADVSFISLRLLFPVLSGLLRQDGTAVCLIKPQFEAGRADVGKHGIVKSPAVHERVLREVLESAVLCGFFVSGLTYSPICGGDGNVEYLVLLTRTASAAATPYPAEQIRELVRKAQTELKK